jgi:capsular polysaccharide biosynthesis protein
LTDAVLTPATALAGNYRPELVKEVGQAWRTKVSPRPPFRKLYISRSRAARRRITNEANVVALLEAQGFETVTLEGKPFAEQVALLAETCHVISNHGAGLTNMLFMVPGTRVTEIRLAGDTHNNCYFSLARALELEYDYRLGRPIAGDDPHTADLLVETLELP